MAKAVAAMGLRHAVITSVDRDDLPDGGARHFTDVIRAIHALAKPVAVEVFTPDFRGVPEAFDVVLGAAPEMFSHNMETVPRLYRSARPGSRFDRRLELLAEAVQRRESGSFVGRVKTGIMMGIGEREEEVLETIANDSRRRSRDPYDWPVSSTHPGPSTRRSMGSPARVCPLQRPCRHPGICPLRGGAAGAQQLPRSRAGCQCHVTLLMEPMVRFRGLRIVSAPVGPGTGAQRFTCPSTILEGQLPYRPDPPVTRE